MLSWGCLLGNSPPQEARGDEFERIVETARYALTDEQQGGMACAPLLEGRIAQYGFVEGRDFVTVQETTVTVQNGKTYRSPRIDYQGTLSMGKELAMVENNYQARLARRRAE